MSWFAVYTKPRWEKKVYHHLLEKGVEAYCPLNRVKKKWSDRFKWIDEPLFKSYVFVKISEEDQVKVRMISGVVNFVYWLGKPAVVKDGEIDAIRRFLNEYKSVQALPLELKTNSRITVRQGALMDKEAKVIKILNNKVRIIIESIGYSLEAVIDKSNAEIKESR